MNRRGFLGALAGLVAAPMIVKIDSIMPVKVMKPIIPEYFGFPEMKLNIEKISVIAQSRRLTAQYTMEVAQDLKAIHSLDAEEEFSKLDKFDPVKISLIRRTTPNLIAYDMIGVQPMSAPSGEIFAMRKASIDAKINPKEPTGLIFSTRPGFNR